MEQLFLVLRGTPATIDEERDPVARGISCSLAQGAEESWIKLGYTRDLVSKDRRAVGDGTVGLAKRTTVLTAKADGPVGLAKRVDR
jgi:hypothetical protein